MTLQIELSGIQKHYGAYHALRGIDIAIPKGQFVQTPTTTAAAALLGIAPTLIFFLIFQRTLTRGIAVGAVK